MENIREGGVLVRRCWGAPAPDHAKDVWEAMSQMELPEAALGVLKSWPQMSPGGAQVEGFKERFAV